MVWLESTEVVSCCLPQIFGWGSANLNHLFFTSPADNVATLNENGEMDNRGVTLTLIKWLRFRFSNYGDPNPH